MTPKILMPSSMKQNQWEERNQGANQKATKPKILGLNHKPHKSELKNKMIKNKMNDKGRTNDVSGVCKWRENTRGKNPYRRSQHTKMGKHKKRCNEQIALAHAFQRMDD